MPMFCAVSLRRGGALCSSGAALSRENTHLLLSLLLATPDKTSHTHHPVPHPHPDVSACPRPPPVQVGVDSADYAEVYNDFWLQMCSQALLLQLLLFWITTTVPAYPLDGSRILVNCLSLCGVTLETAAMTMALLALLSGAALFLYGLLASSMTTFFGVYVCYEAFRVRQKVKNSEAELHPLFLHYNDRLERTGPGVSAGSGPPGSGVPPGPYGAL